jgi:hypothetical protein
MKKKLLLIIFLCFFINSNKPIFIEVATLKAISYVMGVASVLYGLHKYSEVTHEEKKKSEDKKNIKAGSISCISGLALMILGI